MLASICLIAIQIATPVLGSGLIADAALALINKAVPQMPTMLVGGPAKQALGLIAVSLSLPALTIAVNNGCQLAISTFGHLFRPG
jgi:flagellar biosynthesis protein FliR